MKHVFCGFLFCARTKAFIKVMMLVVRSGFLFNEAFMSVGTKDPLSKDDIFANDGTLKATDMCRFDQITGLVIPNRGGEMLLASGHAMSIPADEYFVHPVTGTL